ncbi:hypothetical protein BOTCAL_0434g00010 [Botryotinia calthae]|uniref:Uncharacterized protein n=1 Tax=Botryotinia calthae TaxID=38488 RepID=A0A4Y8CRF8_9HELO|nr:hypothetical protein BOTCAL_0434g00010 [Botryotinia calthae]
MPRKLARPALWCDSEKAYLTSITMYTVNGKKLRIEPRSAMRRMTIEQAKHLPGGVAFARDPWFFRIYTIHAIRNQWMSIERASEAANRPVIKKPAQKLQPQHIPRFIVPSLDSIAVDDFDTEMMAAEWQQEVEEMMAPLKQKWAEEDCARASRYNLQVTAADQILGADFWTQFQEDVNME